jgi:hypothetical protein
MPSLRVQFPASIGVSAYFLGVTAWIGVVTRSFLSRFYCEPYVSRNVTVQCSRGIHAAF